MKRTFTIKAIRNDTEEVLGTKVLVFDMDEKEYERPMFLKTLLDSRDKLADEILRTEIEEEE